MAKSFVPFNMNDKVRFKLPEDNKSVQRVLGAMGEFYFDELKQSKTPDGFYELQMWQFAQHFGHTMFNGSGWDSGVELQVQLPAITLVISEGTGDGVYRKKIEYASFDEVKAEQHKQELRNTKHFDQVYTNVHELEAVT